MISWINRTWKRCNLGYWRNYLWQLYKLWPTQYVTDRAFQHYIVQKMSKAQCLYASLYDYIKLFKIVENAQNCSILVKVLQMWPTQYVVDPKSYWLTYWYFGSTGPLIRCYLGYWRNYLWQLYKLWPTQYVTDRAI